jgi:hypothetical protein
MKRGTFARAAALLCAAASPARALVPKTSLRDRLKTRAESSDYRQASSLADIERFLAELDARGAPIAHGSLGKSSGGRDIPYVVASRPMVRTPAAARALGRPIVLIVAALDASKVAGTETLLAVVRDLCISPEKTVLDDLVLLVVPLVDVDGSERLGAEAQNAPEQNGPPRVGVRDANGIYLDNDFVRAEAPETRALLRFVREWEPNVYIDLSSSDGSFHEFAVTYAPSLHPAAYYGGVYVRDRMLPFVRQDVRAKFGLETFAYGHFGRSQALPEPPPPIEVEDYGWFPRDYRPRIGVNYMGLRGILAVLVSAYSHDPLERRIFTTRAFLESLLGYCTENDDDVVAASRTTLRWLGGTVPLRAQLTSQPESFESIAWENLALDGGPDHEAGVPAGFVRTGTYDRARLPVYDRYLGLDYRVQPKYFIVPAQYARRVESLLRAHAIYYDVAKEVGDYEVEDFMVGSIEKSAAPVNGHATVSLAGTWGEPRSYQTAPGDLMIPGPQPTGPLVSVLLEPESDDGFVAWNAFDGVLATGSAAPILRGVSPS